MGADMLNLEKLRENWMHVNETKIKFRLQKKQVS